MEKIILWILVAVIGVIMLIYYGKTKKPVRNALIGMTTGGLGLLGAHFFGSSLSIGLGLNLFNTAVSLILGVPGVLLLIITSKVL